MTAFSILVVGLLLGMKHATEADHLAAVATLATRQQSLARILGQGVAWGIGHTMTLMLFAGAVLALGLALAPGLADALETAVGVMLVLLGMDVVRRRADVPDRSACAGRWPLRALLVGAMHGLAGSAALVVLSVQAAPTVTLGLGYIALFGIGSIAGMALLSAAIAVPLRWSVGCLAGLRRAMITAAGLSSCALGVFMVVEIGYLKALLFG